MMASPVRYSVGILVVSDTVSAGKNKDVSGEKLMTVLRDEKYFCVSDIMKDCVADNQCDIETSIKKWVDNCRFDLILTVGGTGFTPRDVTPEATKAIIEKEAPHLASYMIMQCCEKTKFAVLSRSVCGIRRNSLILNLPGSAKGAVECFEAIASVLPHAIDQLKCNKERIVADHEKIQGGAINRGYV